MYLKQLKITNYKSFFETKEFNFEPGFNVMLGANSSGKTTVLESIQFNEPKSTSHRSPLNMAEAETRLTDSPSFAHTFAASAEELCKMLNPGYDLYIGLGDQPGKFHTQDLESVNRRLIADGLLINFLTDNSAPSRCSVEFSGWPSVLRNLNAPMPFPYP